MLLAVPDGETGSRNQWVVSIVEALRSNSAVTLKKDGKWSTYDDRPSFKVKRGAKIDPDSLDLGYLNAYRENCPVVESLARERGIPDITYQVGVASGFDLALFAFGFPRALRHYKAFNAAAAHEIEAISAESGGDVVFQIEVPAELVLVARAPRMLRSTVAALAAKLCLELPKKTSPATQFGIHLCFGDLGNRALVNGLRDCSAVVALVNAIVAHWPAEQTLRYVHFPLAAGNEPPTLDPTYYTPLARLEVPATTRVVAGFVHEGLSEEQLHKVLRLVESSAGRQVDVGAPCGLGRRAPDVARTIMQSSRILCNAG
ncbi:hypothetical protein AAHS21_31625 [Mycobacterium sp. 050272]